ncbi:TonB-dependent receptor plug domain-containing protein [Flavobacterium agrisoli]|uniref:TonB-dependent receptor n=1 Tax=Flavobacterium agrisoli TaxID=2793066 RepID=A0A934UKK8_9FLAO|nr:TonB-dependent receptor [Flavobacterium agrisoli]MBK0371206.1 TonB-dependent receptor [Flavobacterium agrisoli]
MTAKKYILLLVLFVSQLILAQHDSINRLQEVLVSDRNLQQFSESQTILQFNDSTLTQNEALLTDLLNFNSTLYFKEYGRGMLSTVAFRGTTASQTAVIWNGININSQMNGSTDFNTISGADFNSVSVKAGGGSVIYGSGAIGGSVHLNTDLAFGNRFENQLKIDYGSFNTQGIHYKTNYTTQKWSTQVGFSRNSSTNDYDYIGRYNWKGEPLWNQNGEYEIIGFNANLAYQLNETNLLQFYSQTSNTDRNTSLVSPTETKSKYVNGFNRNLVSYTGNFNGLTTNLKMAYITEDYHYFPEIESPNYTYGKTTSWISKADLGYHITKNFNLNGIVDYTKTKGYGSGFGDHSRDITSVALLTKQQITDRWQTEYGIRKEFTTNYKSPVLFSVGSTVGFGNFYHLKINLSRNFRIPTFNDLYWEEGGNPDLKPENSYQAEIGNVFSFKKISLTQTFYYYKIDDLLRWVPANNGIWAPQNTDKVNSYGTETLLNWNTHFGENHISCNATYAYTVSENRETKKQLFFVPYHKTTASIAYGYKKAAITYQFLYNGMVFTQSDNDPSKIVPAYTVSNIGIDYDLKFLNTFKIGFQVLNLWNSAYESLENRPMPGRNYNLYLNLKF